jgi:glycosyltransferase involved in cell wall biosynthesis
MTRFVTADETAPLVQFSLIMPAFNAAGTIRAAIESLLVQTHPAFEALVIDDCSHDATAEITREYAARDPRIRLVARSENSGAAACMNAGANMTRYRWMAVFDADAIAPPDWLAQAAVVADDADRSGWAAFGGGCDYFPATNHFERVAFAFEADDTAAVPETFGPDNAREPTIRGTNFFFTRECFDRVGGFAEDIRAAYDRLFLCNAIEQGCRVRFAPALRVGHPLPGSNVREFLRRKNAIERWRLVAAERSPILRQVYRPIWPVVGAAFAFGVATLWWLSPVKAAIAMVMAAVVVIGVFTAKGMTQGLPIPLAICYAAINIVKKICTIVIYVLRLGPAGQDWKQRS